ncbi:MAG: hypothetical protein ABF623_04135 [Gluconobacter cerinus]|uniref:hypothetical protein n=1 Tax=Gluconobacter cerinus TaxID=38307 RepID=UPI0039E9B1E9
MHRTLLLAAYIWLASTGLLHFGIDVISTYLRETRVPGPATTLYYGMNAAYALGQIIFGLAGVWLTWRAPELLGEWLAIILSLAGAVGWLAIGFIFIEYWQPRIAIAAFGILIIAAAMTTRSNP